MEALVSFEIWAAFVLAAGIALIIPGPTIILVISQSIAHGRKAVLPLSAGVVTGDFTAMTLSLLGLGAVLASSAALFSILKWIGAAYLIYLGVKLWCADPGKAEINPPRPATSNTSHFKRAFIVTALNPKSIAFFVAFLPQFVRTQSHATEQFAILGATFLVLSGVNAMLYGFFAGRLRDAMFKTGVRRLFNRCGGSALVGAGLLTTTLQRSS
jgi:threonine/homoserine/homoserine lactone efflux protein